ncbi:NAD(P)/FAD-dependent oxidoreductase [Echinicola marina]|uniref:NAD(P)/FAD-dependent oxidoreductase n=1 Tax=Echinicola marina TaxID=2859768 RepID=UPI001CF64EDA|nr:NAD(P)/FAD-dependent oxidoreductase [Echinicola marina]UCS92604.1 NAD(P)/FAD-dependent oxidoreductase [Echinicola marina]
MIKIGIIGGGAAGFFAAIHAAENGAEVIIYEKTSKTLSKVKVSGGGRCNVTHAAFQTSHLLKNYPRGVNFLKKAFREFQVRDTVEWFESKGVKLKTEEDGRMFPVSNDSQTIVDVLRSEADKKGVRIELKSAVKKIEPKDDGFLLFVGQKAEKVDRVIITSGGSPKQEGYTMYQDLGHDIAAPIPSLFTFNTPGESLKNLPGITVPNAHVRLEGTKLSYEGPLLITHWGVSGPAVLKLSAFGAQWLHDHNYNANAHIRWVSELKEEEIRNTLLKYKSNHPKRKVGGYPLFELPKRLWEHLIEKSGMNSDLVWMNVSKKQINSLEQHIFCYILHVNGKITFKEEFVTAGGVSLKEVNPKTMESRILKGVYFAGEVLDIDGITGGFNFQAAWTTGYIAGKSSTT